MNSILSKKTGMNRRYFLQISGAGLVSATAFPGDLIKPAVAAAYEQFTWISPRGAIEVTDDYAYWVAKKMGFFDDLETQMQPGPSDGTATVKFVDVGQADMGFPSPGVFSFAIQNGMRLKSVFHSCARDSFSFAFRKGEGSADLKSLEGKTILLGSAAWQTITDPLLASQGVDITKVNYVEAGWPTWSTALAAGQGDAALSWEGLRAEWLAKGLDFDYWLGVQHSHLPSNTLVVREADLEDPQRRAYLEKYLRGWAMGFEFAYHNPRFAVQTVFEQFPALANNLGVEVGTMSVLQQINVYRGDTAKRGGWGWHDMQSWQSFFNIIHDIGQIQTPIKAEDVLTNELIASANDFDHQKIEVEAKAVPLNDNFAQLDMNKIEARLYADAIN